MSDLELQSEIQRFGRLYVASSAVNRAVVRSRSRDELLREVTRVLVELGGFAMTFIAWHDPATTELVPVAAFGDGNNYAGRIRMFSDERPEGQGPAGTAFRAGIPYVCNDFLNDSHTLPWRDEARACGWRASAAFPIEIGASRFGILSVYSCEPGMFGPDQVELLKLVSLDVAFALQHLDSEEQRHQAQAALFTSEQNLKLAIDATGLGTFDRALDTGKAVWSGHHEQMFGLEPGSFDGTQETFEKYVHPEDLVKLRRAEQVASDSGSYFSQELRILWPDGSEHWVLGQGGFLYNESGRPYRKYGVVLDITERKRVEAALRDSETRLQQAVRVADIGIFDHDHITNAIYASPRDRAINGVGPDDPMTLEGFIERIHPEDRERIGAAVHRSLDPAGDGFFDVENRLLLPDSTVRWTSTRAQTFFEGEGAARRPVRTVGAVREITAQKQAEDEQKKLSALVAMNRDFIGIASLEGQAIYVNQAGLNLVGLSMADLPRNGVDFVADTHRKQLSEEIRPAVKNSGYWRGESRFARFDTGELIDVEVTAFAIRDDHGSPLYTATVARDIRDRKRIEAEKAQLKEELFQAQKLESIGRLAGGVAHDFNNLLTVINGHSYLVLAKLSPGDPLREMVSDIRSAGESAAALTRQLMAFSRKQVLEPRELDLNRVIEKMRPMLQRLVGEGVELVVALARGGGPVRADPHQVEQVVMNLVMNARDAMPGGGRLWIETACVELDQNYARVHPESRAGPHVLLAVSDSGRGMSLETRQRIFEPFFTTKPVGQGTGLGLAIVQGIVAQNGGHLAVDSAPGRGATFKIYLPAAAGAAADEPAPAVPALGGKEIILVVEDREDVRHYAVEALKSYGYATLQAANAGEALLIFEREQDIHLVLTDVVMPNLSGRELAERLEKIRPGIKVLFMSGYNDDVITHQRTLEEPVHFIEKPFSPEALAEKVRAMLGTSAPPARILVADDEAAVRRFLRQVLEQAGYEVMEAPDGKKAVQAVRSGPVDLMITDLIMPEQEGIETMRALRMERPDLAIVAISGAFEGKLLKAARFLGADAALAKPVDPELLLRTVAEALASRRRPAISSSIKT